MVDDEDVDGSVSGLELKAELTLEGSRKGAAVSPISGSGNRFQ